MVTLMSTDLLLQCVLFSAIWIQVSAIDCYECFSFNKSDPTCGDPFHPAYGQYQKDCTQGKDGRVGGFPARFCIKIIGTTGDDDIEMVYRDCSLQSLDSQCGDFEYERVRYRGCIMSCTQNGCNRGPGLSSNVITMILVFLLTLVNPALRGLDLMNVCD